MLHPVVVTAPHWQDRVVIVTSSTGIGAATVRLAAAAGSHLVIATSDEFTGWELAAETGGECWVGDITLPSAADSILSQCLSRFGRIDAVFNASGLSGRRFGDGPVDECTNEGWDLTLAHNLTSTFYMCRAAVTRMLQQAPGPDGIRGAILNMGSVLSEAPEPQYFATHAYAAAKGGIVALSRSMASYYAAHQIRVNVIAPGLARTPSIERSQADPELNRFLQKKQPIAGGMIDAAEIARAAFFLLGPESRAITGEILRIDAGWAVTGA